MGAVKSELRQECDRFQVSELQCESAAVRERNRGRNGELLSFAVREHEASVYLPGLQNTVVTLGVLSLERDLEKLSTLLYPCRQGQGRQRFLPVVKSKKISTLVHPSSYDNEKEDHE